jgi:membrane-bound inhibitor of C-type lysozyme
MKRYLCALLLASMGVATAIPQAMAQEAQAKAASKKPAKKTATKKSTAKQASKKKAAGAAAALAAAPDEDDIVPDITGSTTVDYQCEMGNKVTIYENQTDSQHVALRWNKKLHRLKRVSTTTGASRFENKKYGLVWIGIPAKGILLDSKKGQQLANECKNDLQLAPKPQPVMTQASENPAPVQALQVIPPEPIPGAEPSSLASQ